jgi:DNA-binding response OmpR family regulator
LVILDLNLPGMDGLDVAREIRRKANTPLIMLTARVEESDQLIGLELGADDYILKPFSPRLVVARVRALLRRLEPAAAQILRAADLEIDLDDHTLYQAGSPVNLTPTEFALLSALASHPGRAFSRLQLLEAAQGVAYEGYERTIDAHIKNLPQSWSQTPKSLATSKRFSGSGIVSQSNDFSLNPMPSDIRLFSLSLILIRMIGAAINWRRHNWRRHGWRRHDWRRRDWRRHRSMPLVPDESS